MRNIQEQVKKAFCYQNLFWPFTVWITCSSDLLQFCKFSAFSLKFQKFFSITRTIFSHSRSEQFWYQNTIFRFLDKIWLKWARFSIFQKSIVQIHIERFLSTKKGKIFLTFPIPIRYKLFFSRTLCKIEKSHNSHLHAAKQNKQNC